MMSSNFIVTNESFFQDDREIAVPASQIGQAILKVRELVRHQHAHFPLFGIFLRFAPSEDATLLAHSTSLDNFKNGETVVFVEMVTPHPVGFPDSIAERVIAPFESVSKTLITDFSGRPHWGKNRDWAFSLAAELNVYGANWERFRNIMTSLDANGIFQTAFSRNAGLFVRAQRSPLATQH